MLTLVVLTGSIVWTVSDSIQTRSLKEIFQTKLAERFSNQAREQRISFDRYVKAHHQTIKLFATNNSLNRYVRNSRWRNRPEPIAYNSTPSWLPVLSVLRKFVQPHFVLLMDANHKTQEYYQADDLPLPKELYNAHGLLIRLSRNQSFLTKFSDTPYILASEPIVDNSGKHIATIMLASPLDEQFLITSQGPAGRNNIVALLDEEHVGILASSNRQLIAPGSLISDLKGRYLITGQGFFDYGASDLVINFASFISTDEVNQLTHAVLATEQRLRSITAIVFVAALSLILIWITRRIRHLSERVIDFSRHMQLEQIPHRTGDQLDILEDRFLSLTEAVKRKTEALEHQAMHDPLTELPNRKLINSELQKEILRGKRSGKPFGLLMMDLDRFKEINDTLGHHVGDSVLQQAGVRISGLLRKTDTVARLGGDEFAILLPETDALASKTIAQKLVEAFQRPYTANNHSLNVGTSIGIVMFPEHGEDVNVLVQRADIAMYVAKRQKLGFDFYDPEKDEHSHKRLTLTSELRHAIFGNELQLHFQPLINVATGEVKCAEALLRWHHKTRGNIPPSKFIPLAEQTELIHPLADQVINKALQECALWTQRGKTMQVSVNLSVHNLHNKDLPKQISLYLDNLQLPAHLLKLEITESTIMTDPTRARGTLEKLHNMGITLSIDDFGTGYSSLSYIRQLPVDEIKIDRSFVNNMTVNENDAIIVRATIELAHNLGLKVVAEGVESREGWDLLEILGCDYIQGYYISRPLAVHDLNEWLSTQPEFRGLSVQKA
ncbi:MAG: hypothetical protein BMS9Abin36_1926 [Gammaproteobacteria bacterium]|nr:MAG: hypothetical protein BMS9Abin36_1926 [Gammaproteobacteria bacterium]